jgi:hypothetical protein
MPRPSFVPAVPDGQSTSRVRISVKTPKQKYFSFPEFGNSVETGSSHPTRGAVRGRHEARRGERWTWAAAAREGNRRARIPRERHASRRTNGADAYGKTVWSWHPLLVSSFAEATSPDRVDVSPGIRKATEARRIRLRGERGISHQTTAQGRPGCLGCPVVFPLCFFAQAYCTGDHGCQPAPGLPCALSFRGARRNQSSGQKCRESVDPCLLQTTVSGASAQAVS